MKLMNTGQLVFGLQAIRRTHKNSKTSIFACSDTF